MKFILIDRIVRFDSPRRISALKGLSLGEEYLADHFPGNPVMPGVLMLEAMVQSGAWLLRAVKNFSFSMCTLKAASNVKYAKFLMPGDQLLLEADLTELGTDEASFSGRGRIASQTVVSARWSARYFNLAQEDARLARNDRIIVEAARDRFKVLGGEELWKQTTANAS